MIDLSLLGYGLFTIAAILALAGPLSIGFAAAVVLTMCPFLRLPIQFGAGELGVRPEDAVMAILTVRCILFHPLPPLRVEVRRFVNSYLVLLVFMVLFTMVAIATRAFEEISWYPHAKALGVTAMGYVGLCSIQGRSDFRRFFCGLLLGGVILSISALVAAKLTDTMVLSDSSAYDSQMVATKLAVTGFALGWNSNVIGVTCGALLLVSLPLIERARPLRTLPIRVAIVGVIGAAMLMSYSRTAIIAVGIVIVFSNVYSRRHRSRHAWILVASAVLLFGLALALGIRPEAFQMSLTDGINSGERLEIWQTSAATVAQWPVGYGVGVGDLAVSNLWGRRLSAHNDWIDFALEIGLAGALCAAVTYFYLWRVMKSGADGSIQPEAPQIFLFFLICSFSFQVFTFSKQPFAIMSGYVGLINALAIRRPELADSSPCSNAELALGLTPPDSATA